MPERRCVQCGTLGELAGAGTPICPCGRCPGCCSCTSKACGCRYDRLTGRQVEHCAVHQPAGAPDFARFDDAPRRWTRVPGTDISVSGGRDMGAPIADVEDPYAQEP